MDFLSSWNFLWISCHFLLTGTEVAYCLCQVVCSIKFQSLKRITKIERFTIHVESRELGLVLVRAISFLLKKQIGFLRSGQWSQSELLTCYTIWQTLMTCNYPYLTTNNCTCFFYVQVVNYNACKGLIILERFMHYKSICNGSRYAKCNQNSAFRPNLSQQPEG